MYSIADIRLHHQYYTVAMGTLISVQLECGKKQQDAY